MQRFSLLNFVSQVSRQAVSKLAGPMHVLRKARASIVH